jgi:hypothetical protein
MACLLTTAKEKGLIRSTQWRDVIICDVELEKVLGRQSFFLSTSRELISSHLNETIKGKAYTPFVCVESDFIDTFLDSPYSVVEYTQCPCLISERTRLLDP